MGFRNVAFYPWGKAWHLAYHVRVNGKWLTILACSTCGLAALGAWAWRRFGPATYVRAKTMFGRARIYQVEDDAGQTVRLLEVGGIVQSGTYLGERYTELVFEYLKRYDAMFAAGRPIGRVCVLGCGGYDYPEHLVANHPGVAVDAVEIDPAITALARRYFFLDRLIEEYDALDSGKLRLICSDALAHLVAEDPLYDAIVNDTFDAGTPPPHLTTAAFARAVHTRLVPGGLYLANIVSAVEGPDMAFLHEQVALLGREFAHVAVFPCAEDSLTEPDNVIVIATDDGKALKRVMCRFTPGVFRNM